MGETRLRNRHTGSLLSFLLRGKSPCLKAESAHGRPGSLSFTVAVIPRVQLYHGLWPFASAQSCRESPGKGANRTELTLPMPSCTTSPDSEWGSPHASGRGVVSISVIVALGGAGQPRSMPLCCHRYNF